MCSRSRGFFERGKTEIKGPLYQEGAGRAKRGPGEYEKTSPPPDRLRRSSPPLYEEGGFFAYVAVFAQFVQLSLAGMQESFLLGKKASIGNSIWPKTSQGDSVLELLTFLHVFDGIQ